MATLVEVFRNETCELKRRQLPLFVDDNLSMVMDLNSMNLGCDNPTVKGNALEEFSRKYNVLTINEVREALQVSCKDLLSILSQTVPCVGCRRSVERVFYQLMKSGHPALDPILISEDGVLSLRDDKTAAPQPLCTLLYRHSDYLSSLVESQPRSKKSRRCVLHSLDSQRTRVVVTDQWRDAWDRMKPLCKDEVLLIEASALLATLNNYLHKHRFCGECRTKVMRAYTLLVEDPDPCKEKGYIPALYSGIKRCLPDKHIHLQCKTDYIAGLITRAEPELLGSRRERHAKTLEIAQEEVLTCLGICVYERLHRIHLRLREEECTCQVLAAVAVDALCRNFELAVETKRGISQLELLYKEMQQEEAAKQRLKEQKRLKKRKKKERRNGQEQNNVHEDKDGCECESEEQSEPTCDRPASPCSCPETRHHVDVLTEKLNGAPCDCEDCRKKQESAHKTGSQEPKLQLNGKDNRKGGGNTHTLSPPKDKAAQLSKVNGSAKGKTGNNNFSIPHCDSCHESAECKDGKKTTMGKGKTWASDHLAGDCGYSSGPGHPDCASGTGSSSLPSSPDGSEVACSDGFCNGECSGEGCTESHSSSQNHKSGVGLQLTLEQMLEESCSSEDDEESYIPAEEVQEFRAQMRNVMEKRQELRETLKNRFAQLCVNTCNPPQKIWK
ncbi:gametogenetin-binding protein 2-like [Thrips palmi]|uniref:Gametogenetin-binding protein 2-like n=1 Tax=Thrips palmi TaxID=161013 RepID=A0A6P8YQE0_THRPL|nr:gametogenetin-binding protein 2-like [Thrips palmi]